MVDSEEKKHEELNILKPLIRKMQACWCFPRDGKPFDRILLLKFCSPALIFGPLVLIGLIGHIYITFKRGLWPEPIDSLSFVIQILMSFNILALFFINYDNFSINVKRMRTYEFGVPPECVAFAKSIDSYSIIAYYGAQAACVFYAFLSYFNDKLCTNSGLTGDEGYICTLPFPLWFPIKTNIYGFEQILLLGMFIVGIFYLPVLCTLATIPMAACGLIIRRLRTLRRIMMKYTSKGGCTKALDPLKLRFFLEYHDEILDCVHRMNEDVGYCHIAFIFFIPMLLALYLSKLIEQKDPAAIIALLPWFFTPAVLCFFGEQLEYERHLLYLVFNDIPWYRMDTKLRKVYYISLCKFQQPIQLKMKSVTCLNNIFLYKILKGTYTFLVYFSNGKKEI